MFKKPDRHGSGFLLLLFIFSAHLPLNLIYCGLYRFFGFNNISWPPEIRIGEPSDRIGDHYGGA